MEEGQASGPWRKHCSPDSSGYVRFCDNPWQTPRDGPKLTVSDGHHQLSCQSGNPMALCQG